MNPHTHCLSLHCTIAIRMRNLANLTYYCNTGEEFCPYCCNTGEEFSRRETHYCNTGEEFSVCKPAWTRHSCYTDEELSPRHVLCCTDEELIQPRA